MDKKRPGPSDEQFNKTKGKMSNAGHTGTSKGKANMKDQQFDEGQSYNEDDGSTGSSSGKSGMKDQQFDEGQSYTEDDGSTVSISKKTAGHKRPVNDDKGNPKVKMANRPSDGMNFNVTNKRASAHQIMTEIARALSKPPQANQPGQGRLQPKSGDTKDRASSASQQKDFDASEKANPVSARTPSQDRGFVKTAKKPESKPGSKTAVKTKV